MDYPYALSKALATHKPSCGCPVCLYRRLWRAAEDKLVSLLPDIGEPGRLYVLPSDAESIHAPVPALIHYSNRQSQTGMLSLSPEARQADDWEICIVQ
jgi:hypothetical protein